ncbi:uncharacterized protein METZ01_LOCUS505008, partial [marine metagenome]
QRMRHPEGPTQSQELHHALPPLPLSLQSEAKSL